MKTFAFACITAMLIAAPGTGSAQILPAANEHITGTILTYATDNDEQNLTLADDRGYTDRVTLADDVVLKPAGVHLARGMHIALDGYNAGKWFDALQLTVIPPRYPVRTSRPY
jgi:hypothetical protein